MDMEIPKEWTQMLETIQKSCKDMAASLPTMKAEGSSGAGMVSAVVNGENKLVDLKIDDAVWKMDDKDAMRVLIMSAVNTAVDNLRKKQQENLSQSLGINPEDTLGGIIH